MKMKNLTEQEIKELEAWIAEDVMEWTLFKHPVLKIDCWKTGEKDWMNKDFWKPHKVEAHALRVLKKCIKKAKESNHAIELMEWKEGSVTLYSSNSLQASAPTLELTICLFAKELFGKDK